MGIMSRDRTAVSFEYRMVHQVSGSGRVANKGSRRMSTYSTHTLPMSYFCNISRPNFITFTPPDV
jgi:hypothetical protein